MRRTLLIGAIVAVALAGAAAWWRESGAQPVTVDEIGDQVQTLPRGTLPVFAGRGDTAALYRFALDEADTLRHMPCTCGCGGPKIGHASNRACYVKQESGASVTWTSHAAT
jgi:hypothetical protein